jgi:hypothetical protein
MPFTRDSMEDMLNFRLGCASDCDVDTQGFMQCLGIRLSLTCYTVARRICRSDTTDFVYRLFIGY